MADHPDEVQSWSAEEELRQVLRRLAHEIRNPLACLQAGVQVMQRMAEPDGQTSAQLSNLLDQIGRIDKVTQGIHMLARLAAGEPRRVLVRELVEGVRKEHYFFAAQAGVQLVRGDGPPCEVEADPAVLTIALGELASNAIKASPDGGMITLSWEAPSGQVAIHVDDEGTGVPDENVDKILCPFFTTQPNGRGLGLTVALRACRLVGARLAWHNRDAGGCRFSILLPGAG